MLSCLSSNLTSVGSSLGFGTERVSNIKETRNRERGSHTYIHERCIDVVAALSVDGDEEGQAAVRREVVHEAVLVVISRKECNAAVFRLRLRGH